MCFFYHSENPQVLFVVSTNYQPQGHKDMLVWEAMGHHLLNCAIVKEPLHIIIPKSEDRNLVGS